MVGEIYFYNDAEGGKEGVPKKMVHLSGKGEVPEKRGAGFDLHQVGRKGGEEKACEAFLP